MKLGTILTTHCCGSRIHITRRDSSSANRRWCALCSILERPRAAASLDRGRSDADSYCRDAPTREAHLHRNNAHRVGEMATGMGFFQKLFSPVSARAELLEELAVLAGRNQGLVDRLNRHAALTSPNIKTGVEALAEKEKLHVKVIHSILGEHNVWAKLPEASLHDGSNNWARLSGDLGVIGALAAELRIDAMKWESVDEAVAEKLLELAIEDDDRRSEERRVGKECR